VLGARNGVKAGRGPGEELGQLSGWGAHGRPKRRLKAPEFLGVKSTGFGRLSLQGLRQRPELLSLLTTVSCTTVVILKGRGRLLADQPNHGKAGPPVASLEKAWTKKKTCCPLEFGNEQDAWQPRR